MSCQQVPTAPAFNPYPRSVQVGEFEVAISGGVWVAISRRRRPWSRCDNARPPWCGSRPGGNTRWKMRPCTAGFRHAEKPVGGRPPRHKVACRWKTTEPGTAANLGRDGRAATACAAAHRARAAVPQTCLDILPVLQGREDVNGIRIYPDPACEVTDSGRLQVLFYLQARLEFEEPQHSSLEKQEEVH